VKLNYKNTVLIGFAFFSICAFWQLYDSLIPLMLKNAFSLGDTVSGLIMASDNILALFLLPFFGTLSDRTHTRIGRRMPFILGGTLVAAAAMLLLPMAESMRHFGFFTAALFLTLTAMGTYRSPAVALMPDITPKPLRSRANAVINLMGAIGGIVSLLLIRLFLKSGSSSEHALLFGTVAAVMLISAAILFFTVNENKLAEALSDKEPDQAESIGKASSDKDDKLPPAVKKSLFFLLSSVALWYMAYNAVTTAFSKYAQSYLGLADGSFADPLMIAMATAIVTYIPAGALASRFGRKKCILAGVLLMILPFSAMIFVRTYSNILIPFFLLVGIGWAIINVNSYPMAVELASGNKTGKYTGYYYTFSMAAQIITPVLSGFFLEHVGYHTLFPYAALFMALAFCTMLFVKHGANREIPAPADQTET